MINWIFQRDWLLQLISYNKKRWYNGGTQEDYKNISTPILHKIKQIYQMITIVHLGAYFDICL